VIFSFLGGHASKQQMSSVQEGESGVRYPDVPSLDARQFWSRMITAP